MEYLKELYKQEKQINKKHHVHQLINQTLNLSQKKNMNKNTKPQIKMKSNINKPIKPLGPFFLFQQNVLASSKNEKPQLSNTQIIQKNYQQWNNQSINEKQKYYDKYNQLLQEYQSNMKIWSDQNRVSINNNNSDQSGKKLSFSPENSISNIKGIKKSKFKSKINSQQLKDSVTKCRSTSKSSKKENKSKDLTNKLINLSSYEQQNNPQTSEQHKLPKQFLNNISQLEKNIKQNIEILIEKLLNEYKQYCIENEWVYVENDYYKGVLIEQKLKYLPTQKPFLRIVKATFQEEEDNKYNEIILFIDKIINDLLQFEFSVMQVSIKEFFSQKYDIKVDDIKISRKQCGNQFGNIVTFDLVDQNQNIQQHKYFIKTHDLGLRKIKYSAQCVNPCELFIYKVLEFSEFGSEVDFFYYDKLNFYISTKDTLKYSSQQNDEKFSQTYGKFLEQNKNGFQLKPEYLQCQKSIINGLMQADILSRILLLSDITSSRDNIMFIQQGACLNDDIWVLKIVDFKLQDFTNKNYIGKRFFDSFIYGIGDYMYDISDQVKKYYLGERDLIDRRQYSKQFPYQKIIQAIDKAVSYAQLNTKIFDEMDKTINHSNLLKRLVQEFETAALEHQI